MIEPCWWRVVIGIDHNVISADRVPNARLDTDVLFYVVAQTKERAERTALQKYMRRLQSSRRAELTAQGRCHRCGQANDRKPKRHCSRCEARKQARKPEPGYRNSDPHISEKVHETEARRLQVLREVQQVWVASPNNKSFTDWLNAQVGPAKRRVA